MRANGYDGGNETERVGFEPTVRRNVQQISSLPHSTALAPLRGGLV